MTVLLEEDYCPECGVLITAASESEHVNDAIMPEPGNISICFECTSYLRFNENLKLVKMTVDDIVNLSNEELLLLTKNRRDIKAFKKWMESQNE